MAWLQPKTDWRESDWFNIEDYNRIKNNLNEIRLQALVLWPDFSWDEMGVDKDYNDYFYADEINQFESNLEHICTDVFPFVVGDGQTFYDNQPFIDWRELNRIETACRLIYRNIQGRIQGRQRLPITLNGGRF